MTKPVRIQSKRTKGFNLQDASPNGLPVVYVGRPTKWGNPYCSKALGNFVAAKMFSRKASYPKIQLLQIMQQLPPTEKPGLLVFVA